MILKSLQFYIKKIIISKRISHRNFSTKQIFNNTDIVFLTNGSLNQSKSILIVSNNQRYLINCGEGIVKLFEEYGKMACTTKTVLLTNKNPENVLGLLSLALKADVNGILGLSVFGFKEGIDYVRSASRILTENLNELKYYDQDIVKDNHVTINKFSYPINKESNRSAGYLFTILSSNILINKKPINNINANEDTLRFSPQSSNDTIAIKSETIMPDKFIVFECLSFDQISELSNAIPYENLNNSDGVLKLVIHLTDRTIFDSDSYKMVLKRIHSYCDNSSLPLHIVVDSSEWKPTSFSTFYLQTMLNSLFDSEVFPKLKLYEDYLQKNINQSEIKDVEVHSISDGQSLCKVVYSEPLMQYNINNNSKKRNEFSTETWHKMKHISEKSVIESIIYQNEQVPHELMTKEMNKMAISVVKAKELLGGIKPDNYPYITFFGTSSSSPNKYRNITSILIEPYSDVSIIFDIGEFNLIRMITMYGIDKANSIIRNIQMICISHHHLDHHSGLYALLQYRQKIGQCSSCMILSGHDVYSYTKKIDILFKTNHCSYNCEWLMIDKMQKNKYAINNQMYGKSELTNYERKLNVTLTPVRVHHTSTSYGFVLTGKNVDTNEDWKITFSGDRTPKYDDLIAVGMNSDILIHEASMDDGLEKLAEDKRHSTMTQAIKEGIKMKAKYTLLTHFSSRYALVPPVTNNYENVGQAYDFMRVNLQTCKYLNILDKYLEFLFPKHWARLLVERQKILRDVLTNQSRNEKKSINKC